MYSHSQSAVIFGIFPVFSHLVRLKVKQRAGDRSLSLSREQRNIPADRDSVFALEVMERMSNAPKLSSSDSVEQFSYWILDCVFCFVSLYLLYASTGSAFQQSGRNRASTMPSKQSKSAVYLEAARNTRAKSFSLRFARVHGRRIMGNESGKYPRVSLWILISEELDSTECRPPSSRRTATAAINRNEMAKLAKCVSRLPRQRFLCSLLSDFAYFSHTRRRSILASRISRQFAEHRADHCLLVASFFCVRGLKSFATRERRLRNR